MWIIISREKNIRTVCLIMQGENSVPFVLREMWKCVFTINFFLVGEWFCCCNKTWLSGVCLRQGWSSRRQGHFNCGRRTVRCCSSVIDKVENISQSPFQPDFCVWSCQKLCLEENKDMFMAGHTKWMFREKGKKSRWLASLEARVLVQVRVRQTFLQTASGQLRLFVLRL